jgi:8-oxo-dGTP pyrophosphatase MutT (NUDIX family)
MKARPAARLLILDPAGDLLLFRFVPYLGGAPFWATPGGAVDPGESYAQAARRELWEEVGLDLDPGPEVARREVCFTTLEGEPVSADERYFLLRTQDRVVAGAALTDLERRVMTTHRWWTPAELAVPDEPIFPEDVVAMLMSLVPGWG